MKQTHSIAAAFEENVAVSVEAGIEFLHVATSGVYQSLRECIQGTYVHGIRHIIIRFHTTGKHDR
jgi:hypothetical protein